MNKVLVVAPHPDDETLGCGGTLLRHKQNGDQIYWLIVTRMGDEYSPQQIVRRKDEIKAVATAYGFDTHFTLDIPAATLDTEPKGGIISSMAEVFKEVEPQIVYVPHPSDAHTDHRAVFDAAMACCKWFRYPSVEKIIACEIPSETDFNIDPSALVFRPNLFVDITELLDAKIKIMELYAGEMGEYPFPRSATSIRSLAHVRGGQAGYAAAEAFMVLKERW